MSRNKQRRVGPAPAKTAAPNNNFKSKNNRSNTSGKKKFAWLSKLPMFIVLTLALWAFLFFYYGDVFYVAEQRSFFSFDPTAMQFYLSEQLGWLYATGRFMLLAGKLPLLGTLLVALMLGGSAKLLDKAFGFKGWLHVITLIVPFGYVAYLLVKDLNLFYLHETSWTMTIPLIALVVSLVAYAISLVIKAVVLKGKSVKDELTGLWKKTETLSTPQAAVLVGVVVLMFVLSAVGASTYGQNARITCMMERAMYAQDWDAMIKYAKSATQPSRTVSAYYAMALNETDQMDTEVFNLRFQYPDAHLTRQHGDFDAGLDYIVVDCNFSAGLTQSSYHEAMEQIVLDGPSIHHLKRMAQCSLIDGDYELADKYLSILDRVPFESEFVEKYSAMIGNPDLISQDPEMAVTLELHPVSDSFEQNYREPLFLGYNVLLNEAKTIRGLKNSMYACMYSKDLKAFGDRIRSFVDNGWPMSIPMQEGLLIMNIRNIKALKPLIDNQMISKITLQEMQSFMADCFADANEFKGVKDKEIKNKRAKEKAAMYPEYRGSYLYYYYFQNVPDENYIMPGEAEKGGVN